MDTDFLTALVRTLVAELAGPRTEDDLLEAVSF